MTGSHPRTAGVLSVCGIVVGTEQTLGTAATDKNPKKEMCGVCDDDYLDGENDDYVYGVDDGRGGGDGDRDTSAELGHRSGTNGRG